jgi:hypothetical protein
MAEWAAWTDPHQSQRPPFVSPPRAVATPSRSNRWGWGVCASSGFEYPAVFVLVVGGLTTAGVAGCELGQAFEPCARP